MAAMEIRVSPRPPSLSGRSRSPHRPVAAAPQLRLTSLWQLCFALLMLSLLLSISAFPADAGPDLEFQPSPVSLPVGAGQQVTALIVVRNRTDAALRDLRLSWLPKPDLEVQCTTALSLSVLAPHADYVWTLTIKPGHALAPVGATGPSAVGGKTAPVGASPMMMGPLGPQETRIDDSLDLRLDYHALAGGRSTPQVILKSLPIKTQDLGDLDKVLDVQVKTTLESLASSESGSIYLLLKNNSARTINILSIAPIGKGVSFCRSGKAKLPDDSLPFCFYSTFYPVTLTPYQTAIEEFQVRAYERVKAGKYLLAFQIATQSYEGGVPLRRSIVVSQTVDVDVLGESAILKVADLPSFFLLPGALFLLAIGVLWQTKWLQVPPFPPDFPLKWKDPGFWLVSLTLSLLVAILPWLWTGRWYFTSRRGLQDVALLWFASILAGVAAYMAWQLLRNLRMPAEQDSPLDALHKLQLRKDGLLPIKVLQRLRPSQDWLLRKRVKLKGSTDPAFVLAGSSEDAVVWLCPPAKIEVTGEASKVEGQIKDQLDNKNGKRDLHTLFVLLNHSDVKTTWLTKPVDKVSYATQEQIERWNDEDIFLQME